MCLRFEPGALARVESIPDDLRSDSLREWAVRAALRDQDWRAALRMLERLLRCPERGHPLALLAWPRPAGKRPGRGGGGSL
jgi:hypothetical protein